MREIKEALHRYPEKYGITSALDPLADVLTLLHSLTSEEYLIDVISAAHKLPAVTAKHRSRQIAPHIRAAIGYIEQSAAGPRDVAFLPIYYALLNFAKVYVLLGNRHADLAANRWHGAQYAGHAKNSQSLLTEEVTLRRGGALPLFYETLTGRKIRNDVTFRMSEIYPYVVGIGAEYNLASGKSARVGLVRFGVEEGPKGIVLPLVSVQPLAGGAVKRRELKLLLSGFRKHPTLVNMYSGPSQPLGMLNFRALRGCFRTFLLYQSGATYYTPLCSRNLLLPEEIPIILAFFHLALLRGTSLSSWRNCATRGSGPCC